MDNQTNIEGSATDAGKAVSAQNAMKRGLRGAAWIGQRRKVVELLLGA
ncbi:hypothetical protein OKW40_004057 [Paraburkholderia sp. RAU6.4a]